MNHLMLLCILTIALGCRASNQKAMNGWSSESHRACTNGRVVTDEDEVSDRQAIEQAYKDLCEASARKDSAAISRVLAPEYVLVHMTGMKQSREQYIKAVLGGTLNYYEHQHERITVEQHGDKATLRGQTRVNAAVFGGGRHTWRLQQDMTLRKENGRWLITRSEASTY